MCPKRLAKEVSAVAVHSALTESQPAVLPAGQIQPLAVGGCDAARLLGISERMLQRLTSSGEIPSVLIRGRRVYRVAALDVWLQQQEHVGEDSET